jgi:hypothetical protein
LLGDVSQCVIGRAPLPAVACSGNGVCNLGTGQCRCEAGWRGEACGTRDPRPCNVMGFHGQPQRTSSYCDGRCDTTRGYAEPQRLTLTLTLTLTRAT